MTTAPSALAAAIHASAAVRLQILARARFCMTSVRSGAGRPNSVGAGQMRAVLLAIAADGGGSTLQELSDQLGISPVTVWRAVAALGKDGALVSIPGRCGAGTGKGFRKLRHRVSWERLLELVPAEDLPHLEAIARASMVHGSATT